MKNDRDLVKDMLRDRITDLCAQLLPDGKRKGHLWVAHNPVLQDFDQSPEFKVYLNRSIGAWVDYRSGEKGDVIGLVAYCLQVEFAEAMVWSRNFLGLSSMSGFDRRAAEARAAEARRTAEERNEANRLKHQLAAEKLYDRGFQDGANSTAEALARAYFAARRCPLDLVPNRDLQTFRFSASTEYWQKATWTEENGRRIKTRKGPDFPAVHSAMRAPAGQVTAVHLTFLHPSRPEKAPVAPGSAKLMYGEAGGSMIRISHGPEGEPPETALAAHPLVLCEGIEDALSLAIAIPEARVWAAGSLNMMAKAPVWLPCIGPVIVARDNDWGKKQAEEQFDQVLEQLSAAGKPMTVISSHVGKDFNDLAQEEGA